MTNTLQNKIDEAIAKADAEIMDWFFDVIKINSMKLDVETIQNSTTLKEILKDVFSSITTIAQEEARKEIEKEIEDNRFPPKGYVITGAQD